MLHRLSDRFFIVRIPILQYMVSLSDNSLLTEVGKINFFFSNSSQAVEWIRFEMLVHRYCFEHSSSNSSFTFSTIWLKFKIHFLKSPRCDQFHTLYDLLRTLVLYYLLVDHHYKIVVYIGSITSLDSNHLPHASHYDVLNTTLKKGCS